MNADLYLVRVQDIGEVYEYLFSSLTAAQKLFEDEMLPCSLVALDITHCQKILLTEKYNVHFKGTPPD